MFTGPCFEVDDVAKAMTFYLDAFGARILLRECLLDGQVLRAELTVGAHLLTLTQVPSPATVTNPSARLTIETDDVQGLLRQARSAGAEVESASADGPRVMIRDPIGQRWLITST